MDYKNPDYPSLFLSRMERLRKLRANPKIIPALKIHYRNNPIDFLADWGVTSEPRNLRRGLPVSIPFVPFPRQVEWLEWILERWKAGEPGLTEKSRDMGCSVAFMSLMATLALFHRQFTAGVGSRKQELVDRVGDPKTLFYKARAFLEHVPREFRGGWNAADKNLSSFMKIEIPHTGSTITGEAGDNIGRGGRSSIYGVDEKAFIQHQSMVDGSLSANTDCQIDLSSVNGMNEFAEKRFSGRVQVFTFHWRDDPRKDDVWYVKQQRELDPLIVAQEIDLDYHSSKLGILIPSAWVQASIDSHLKLKIMPSGERTGALDVADEGIDLNAYAGRYGIMLNHLESWSGKGGDIYKTTQKAFNISDQLNIASFRYDGDGLGAGVRGDARMINENRDGAKVEVVEFRGSGEVVSPDAFVIKGDDKRAGRTNKDFFANRKAQGWWHLRTLFQNTARAVLDGEEFNPDEIISISGALPELTKLTMELSQVTYDINTAGKVIIDKSPDGTKSPNHADAAMILYAPATPKRRGILDF